MRASDLLENPNALECLNCGAVERVELPIAVSKWAKMCRAFERRNAGCEPRPAGRISSQAALFVTVCDVGGDKKSISIRSCSLANIGCDFAARIVAALAEYASAAFGSEINKT